MISELSHHARDWPTIEQIDLADGQPIPRVNVSVKLSSIYSQFDSIDPEGTKRIVKEGPTGLITTGTRPLKPQLRTRVLEIHVDPDQEAIGQVLQEMGPRCQR